MKVRTMFFLQIKSGTMNTMNKSGAQNFKSYEYEL
jgi:hypothetical protein